MLLFAIVWAVVAYEIPVNDYAKWFLPIEPFRSDASVFTLSYQGVSNAPPIQYSASWTFKALQDFSVLNSMIVSVAIYDVNISLTQYYYGLTFVNATQCGGAMGITPLCPITFTQVSNGIWEANGTILFPFPVRYVAPILVPWTLENMRIDTTKFFASFANQTIQNQIVGFPTIEPVSATDQILAQANADKFQMTVFGAIGILIIDGILVGIVFNKIET